MLKKLVCAVTLTAAMAGVGLPAFADVKVDGIVINQSVPEDTNIRVNLTNDGAQAESPSCVELQVRDSATSEWRSFKTWNLTSAIAPGNKLSLDYLSASADGIDPALMNDTYELRAVVTGTAGPLASYELHHSPNLDIPLSSAGR